MRTVDPDEWFHKMRKSPRHLSRSKSFNDEAEDVEMRIRSSFLDTLKEYWRNCSVVGVQRISNKRLSKCERYWHGAVLIVALWVGVSMLSLTLYQIGIASPIQVNLLWTQHSIQQMPFPAVALCSPNVISKAPLLNYSRYLDSSDQNNTYHLRAIQKNLLKFGALVTLDIPPVDVMFMKFLEHADPHFNVSRFMYEMASPCASILVRCSWRGRTVPCEQMFAPRITPLGYCCVFNSRYSAEDMHRPPKVLNMVGRDYGLAVVVRENSDEFAFVRRAGVGLEVLLFDGGDYPIMSAGGVRLFPVARNASVFVSLRGAAQRAGRGVRCPPRRARHARCVARCRRRSLRALCACRLHTFVPAADDATPLCSLTHLHCLNKHKEKLMYYYPIGYADASLNEELVYGLFCKECVPDCTRYVYSASVSTAPYSAATRKAFTNIFSRGLSTVNSSVIRVFYSSEHQQLYGIETNVRWFESFATISGMWSVILGATIISGSELVYHFTIRWVHHYRHRTRITRHLHTNNRH